MSAACINAQVFLHDRFLFVCSEKKTEALNQLPLKHQAVSHLFYLFIFFGHVLCGSDLHQGEYFIVTGCYISLPAHVKNYSQEDDGN